MTVPHPELIVVIEPPLLPALDGMPTQTADEYLEGERGLLAEDVAIINLCRSFQYLTKGYYVSLLADARHQRVFPTLKMIEEITNPFAYLRTLREAGVETIDFKIIRDRRRLLPKVIVLAKGEGTDDPPAPLVARQERDGQILYERTAKAYWETTAVFGKTLDGRFRKHCAAIFKVYAFPLLRIRIYDEDNAWKVGQIFPVAPHHLSPPELELLTEELSTPAFLKAPVGVVHHRPHRIACLWEAGDPFAPSDDETLDRFARIAARNGILFERITKRDLASLAEYDALFIRTVTAIDHYAFTFAQTAETLDIPVIDDPQSIIKCSNKVYLHELFRKNGIPTPRTMTVSRKTSPDEIRSLGLPLIVKLPQGTFSQAVKKAVDVAELKSILQEMFKQSPLLIVQEYIPTPFDWRIGILEGQVLYACKYHMAKDHWQIVRRYGSGFTRFGEVEAVRMADVPETVKAMALEAAELIGNGLYGVDIKETAAGPLIIEVNDNPTIETGDEDTVEKDRIYDAIITTFMRRIQDRSRVTPAP